MNNLKQVLIVDDEPDIIELVSLYIGLAGINADIKKASNSMDALAIFKTAKNFDLIISDIRMPGGFDGLQLTEEIKKINSAQKVVIMSGHSDYEESDILKKGASYFIKKPFTHDELSRVLSATLGTK